nr:hypothetical protein [Tanacetum cinerariifolium]
MANLNTYPSKRFNSFFYDDDDDEDYTVVITPNFPITVSLIMENEHLDTIPETESDEFIKSSVENLVPILIKHAQSEEAQELLNKLLHDVQNIHEELTDEFNPIHNEDLDSTLKNNRFDTKSYLLESLPNRDTLMASSPKIDSLLAEFADFHANPNTIIESLPTFPIPIEDSDPFMEEIDLFLASDGSIPSGIDSEYSDSEGDNLFPKWESNIQILLNNIYPCAYLINGFRYM